MKQKYYQKADWLKTGLSEVFMHKRHNTYYWPWSNDVRRERTRVRIYSFGIKLNSKQFLSEQTDASLLITMTVANEIIM